MPGYITVNQMVDLTNMTIEDFGAGRFNQIWQTITRYEVLPRLLKKDKISFQGGDYVRRNLMHQHSDSARMVGLAETDKVNIPDLLTHMRIDWRFSTWNWAWERREALMQRGPHEIVNLIQTRRLAGMAALADLMEAQVIADPADPNNELDVLGVYYWFPKATGLGGGHTGGLPLGGYTDVGGVDPSTHTGWKSYQAGYTNISDDDLLEEARKAALDINFESPIDAPDYRRGRGQVFRNYVNRDTFLTLTAISRKQNDNLGGELFSYNGGLTFNRSPIIRLPKLDSDTSDPWLMLNFDTLFIACLDGDYMTDSGAMKAPDQHNVVVGHGDLTWALGCDDRRANAVLNKL
jgi:hypothetical protein